MAVEVEGGLGGDSLSGGMISSLISWILNR